MKSDIPEVVSERRLGWLYALFVGAFLMLTARLAQIQFVQASTYRDKVEESRTETVRVPARRGDIVDRHGRPFASTEATYDLLVYPVVFRESNRIDALTDLIVAWRPTALPVPLAPLPQGLAPRADARRDRFLAVYAARHDLVLELLGLPCSRATLERNDLIDALADLRHPRGDLILPPSRLARRLLDALAILADSEELSDWRRVRDRLDSSATLGQALGLDPKRVVAGIEEEMLDLIDLAERSAGDGPSELLTRVLTREVRDTRRLERRITDIVDDAIALQRFGDHDLSRLDGEEFAEFVHELRIPDVDVERLEEALSELEQEVEVSTESTAAETSRLVHELLGSRRIDELESFEMRSVARLMEVWEDDATALKRGYGRMIRELADFEQARFLTPEKEWARRLQYKGGVPYEIGRNHSFETALRVWNSFGLSRLGFDVRPSYGRTYWCDERGVASLLIGRVSRTGVPLGGLEAALGGTGAASIVGKPGAMLKRREPGGGWTELSTSRPPVHGARATLTLDRELQDEVEGILAEMTRVLTPSTGGGACVIDLESGDILVLASSPRVSGAEYLERFFAEDRRVRARRAARAARAAGDLDGPGYHREVARLQSERERTGFYDRATAAGLFGYRPPGSVMKALAAIAILELGVVDPAALYPSRDKGPVDLHGALVHSSNDYFRHAGRKIGKTELLEWYGRFGLFAPIPFLATPSQNARREAAIEGDAVINLVIGQGSLSSSPLEVAALMACFGGYGVRVTPRIVSSIGDAELIADRERAVDASRASFDQVLAALHEIALHYVPEPARRLKLAGKTGTGDRHHGDVLNTAWFAGVVPYDRPRLAFAVMCEQTRNYGKAVAEYAARIVERCLEEVE